MAIMVVRWQREGDGRLTVNLPCFVRQGPYNMKDGTVAVEVPDDEVDGDLLSVAKIRHKYRGLREVDNSRLQARLLEVAPGKVKNELRDSV